MGLASLGRRGDDFGDEPKVERKDMIRVAIESPLKGNLSRNRRYAVWCAYHCYTHGEAAYASHLIFPFFLDDEVAEHREFGIKAGYSWAQCADIVAFYLDLGESGGMSRARKRWDNRIIENRWLPDKMYQAFLRCEFPQHTRGFDAAP